MDPKKCKPFDLRSATINYIAIEAERHAHSHGWIMYRKHRGELTSNTQGEAWVLYAHRYSSLDSKVGIIEDYRKRAFDNGWLGAFYARGFRPRWDFEWDNYLQSRKRIEV